MRFVIESTSILNFKKHNVPFNTLLGIKRFIENSSLNLLNKFNLSNFLN